MNPASPSQDDAETTDPSSSSSFQGRSTDPLSSSRRRRRSFQAVTVLSLLAMFALFFDNIIARPQDATEQSKLIQTKHRDVATTTDDKKWMRFAKDGLKTLDGAFDTKFSTTESVLLNGFPTKWQPCTLLNLLSQAGFQDPNVDTTSVNSDASNAAATLGVTITGGSASARSASNCPIHGTNFSRYSDVLDYELSLVDTNPFKFANVAHGSTDSLWSALMMDELMNASQTDILIWEFAINDARRASRPELFGPALEIWFARVVHQFAAIGRAPPPILFLYLWDGEISPDWKLYQSAFFEQREVLSRFREAGLNIAVINVGGTIEGRTAKSRSSTGTHPFPWLDDIHHPNCACTKLISAMIRHLFYLDIMECTKTSAIPRRPSETLLHLPISMTRRHDPLFSLLVSDSVSVSSHMQYTPQQGESSLAIRGLENATIEGTPGAKASETRVDRKVSYKLNGCDEGGLKFVLLEPGLEWLGLRYDGRGKLDRFDGNNMKVWVNGVPADARSRKKTGMQFDVGIFRRIADDWIHIPSVLSGNRAERYEVTLCIDAGEESKCPYLKTKNSTEACSIWESVPGGDWCPFRKPGNLDRKDLVERQCLLWYKTPRAQQLGRQYGSWVTTRSGNPPQLGWIVAVKKDNYASQ